MALESLEPRRARAVADTDALVALAHRARSGNECTCATGRGTIVNFDLREPNDARAFVVRGARRREVNALTWRNEHALFHASDAVVVELDARKMSAAGDAAVIRRFDGAGDVVNGVDVDQDDAMLAACDDAGEVIAYDLSNGEISRRLRGHDGCVTAVAFRRKRGASEVRDGVDGLSRDEVGRQGEERARADVGREEHAERRGLRSWKVCRARGRRVSVDRRGREREGVQSADAALVGVLSRRDERRKRTGPSPRRRLRVW